MDFRTIPTSPDSTPEHAYHLDNSRDDDSFQLKSKDNRSSFLNPSLAESLFDDPVYSHGYTPPPPGPPPIRSPLLPPLSPLSSQIFSKLPSLKRAASSLRRKRSTLKKKSESMSDLLDQDSGDYDVPRSSSAQSHSEALPIPTDRER